MAGRVLITVVLGQNFLLDGYCVRGLGFLVPKDSLKSPSTLKSGRREMQSSTLHTGNAMHPHRREVSVSLLWRNYAGAMHALGK